MNAVSPRTNCSFVTDRYQDVDGGFPCAPSDINDQCVKAVIDTEAQ